VPMPPLRSAPHRSHAAFCRENPRRDESSAPASAPSCPPPPAPQYPPKDSAAFSARLESDETTTLPRSPPGGVEWSARQEWFVPNRSSQPSIHIGAPFRSKSQIRLHKADVAALKSRFS